MMSVGEQAMPPKVAYSINCSLCGCNGASVRCEKCNSMAFCIGCDDMYHRHPKRRNHLRQAVALEFLQALEKHNNAQAEAAQQRAISVKSPLPASNHQQQQSSAPVVDNQSLYPWRRPRTMPRMPENFDRIQPLSLTARGSSSPSPTPHQQVQQQQQQQQQKPSINSAYWTQPLPLQQHQQQQPLMMVHHPSKMPVPPPRRKRRGLSFSGLKDTFRRIVNPGGYHKHHQQQLPQAPEPIYATIIRPAPQQQQQQPVHQKTALQNGARQLNGGNSNSLPRSATPTTVTAAFRPLPALPPEPQDERELIYENTRKHSLPVGGAFTDYQRQKQQQQQPQPAPFASSFDLREYENFVRANGGSGTFDPRRTSMEQLPMMASAEVRSSTMPFRRNFSCADITTGVTAGGPGGPHRCINSLLHQQQQQQLPLFSPVSSKAPSPMPWAANSSQQCLNCTSLAALHHQQHQHQQQLMMMGHHHGSTQSLYPGFGSGGTGSGLFSPNIFSGGGSGCCTPSIINGSVCGSSGQQHWCNNNNNVCGSHCGRGIHPLTSSTSGHHSLASSMEELNHHHSHPHHPHHHNHHSNHQHRINNNNNHRHNSSASLKGGRSFEDDDFEDEDDLLSEDEEYEEEEEEDGSAEVSRRMMAKAATRGHHRKNGGNSQSSTTTASSSSSSRTKATKDSSVFSPSLYQVPSGHPGGKQQNGRKISSSSSSTSSSVARTYKKQQPTTTAIPTVPADVLRRSQRHQAEDKRAAEDQQENDEGEEEKEVVNEQGQWSCRFCTFFNDPQKNICDICAKTRRHLRPSPPVTVQQQQQQQQQQQSSPKTSSSENPSPRAVQAPALPMPSLANSKALDHYGSPGPRELPSTISSSLTVQQQQQKPVPTKPTLNSTNNDSKVAEVPKTATTATAAAAQTELEKPKQQQQQKLQQPHQQQPQIQPQQKLQQPQQQHCIKDEVISAEDDNDLLRRRSSSISSTQTDVAEEEVENSMDQDYLYFQRAADPKQQLQQLRNQLKSSSHQQQSSSELLDFYIRKLSLADPSSSASPSSSTTSTTVATALVSGNQPNTFDHHQMEALIGSWRYEKAMLDAEREQLRWAEKERRQMAKMIDLHRRIGGGRGGSGYLSDGTTTEEELDREVEQVFRAADTAELRAKLAGIEDDDVDNDGDDDETAAEELPSAAAAAVALLSDASTTPDADLFTGPLPSRAAAAAFAPNSSSASTSAASTTFPSSPPSKRAPSPVALAAQHLSTPAVCTSVSLALSEALPDNKNLLPQTTSDPVAIPLPRQIQQQQQHQEPASTGTFEKQQQQVLDLTSIEVTPPEEEEEEEAVEYPPVDIRRWSRPLEDDVDFEWARTEFECELCTATVPVQDIVSMISCTHTACRDCLKAYFTVQIRERQRLVITCPFCEQPAIGADEDELVFEYLGLFDPMLRHLVEPEVYELWQHKLRDRALMRDPNFLWCTQCSSGFITPNPLALTVMCPDCRQLTCQKCKRPWKKQHFNISCAAYAQWEVDNDPSFAEQQLNKHLKEFGIECPNCKFRYQLAKGGCMHFRCLQCGYDFCGGCSRPFKLGNRCFRARMCAALGLHAHHPRNCLFYLRDKEIADLKALLDEHQVPYRTELEGDQTVTRCAVMEQKETDSGMKDEPCNRFVESAGLCKLHYKEYLGTLIYQHCIDPISIFSEVELELVLRRENIRIPNQKVRNMASMQRAKEVFSRLENGGNSSTSTSSSADDDEKYRKMLVELILEKVPLDLWE